MTVTIEQLREAWTRTIVPAVSEQSIPVATLLQKAEPIRIIDGWLVIVAFPPGHAFHAGIANDTRNRHLVEDTLFKLTGETLSVGIAK